MARPWQEPGALEDVGAISCVLFRAGYEKGPGDQKVCEHRELAKGWGLEGSPHPARHRCIAGRASRPAQNRTLPLSGRACR